MTIETVTPGGEPLLKSGPYTGDGVATVFDYDFQIQAEAELLVLVKMSGETSGSALDLNTDYTIAGVGNDDGGQITLTDPALMPTGAEMVIEYAGQFDQSVEWSNQGEVQFSLIEDGLDKITMHLRSLRDGVKRAVKIDTFDTTSPAALVDSLFSSRDTAVAKAAEAAESAADAALYDGPRFDTVTDFFTSTDTSTANTYARTDAEGFAYRAVDVATATTVANAGPQNFEVLPVASGALPALAFKTGTDTEAVDAAIAAALPAGSVSVDPSMTPDYSALDANNLSEVTVYAEDGTIVVGGVGIEKYGINRDHIVFRSRRGNSDTTRLYVEPPESTLFNTDVQSGVITSLTAFFDAYDEQGKLSLTDPDVTGPHYRDGGVSCFVDNTPPFGDARTPEYSPAGIVAFNAKVSGNWWPFRPSAGLSVSERPLATAFQLPLTVANAGPTFAGGGVYPTNRWRPGKAYSVGDICHDYGRVYEVVTAGTSGQTPPLHDGAGGARADGWDATILTTVGTWNTSTSVSITNITQADPGVVTTGTAHGLSVGDPVAMFNVGGMTEVNSRTYYVATVPSTTTLTFSNARSLIEVDTSGFTAYTSGGTLETGFWEGTDGGGVVEYALLEQIFPSTMDQVLFLGEALEDTPLMEMGSSVQIGGPTYLKAPYKIMSAKQEADGSGTTNNSGLHSDFFAGMTFGYAANVGLLAKGNSTTQLKFVDVSASYSEKVKPDGDTTVDVTGVNIVKFNDSAATNFTGFTGAETGQVIHLLFNNSNTTLTHSSGSLRIPGGANRATDNNDGVTVVMRSPTSAQVMG